ncbi:GGDEF domain-containing protein [Litorilituus lipolyticus]|uniref:diguanylate cyclase n=1 Tax=Litorilituus lipolyticus TaxID=2491017 RepID=A0A502L2Z8_9GAMM|nr:GGDEF domain-containing protein [Litorilituus lipolyticus]TPH18096.1 GGDEF domain-containing protein [Litorilituus lipolyticus]
MKDTQTTEDFTSEYFKEVLTIFFDALPDPIFVINQNGLILRVLGGNSHKINCFPNIVESQYLHETLPKEIADVCLQTINKAIEDDSLTCIDYEVEKEHLSPEFCSNQFYQGRIFPLKQHESDLRAVLWIAINTTEKVLFTKKLNELATKDELTGINNRRYFNGVMKRTFDMFQRDKVSFCILMLDVDFFKKVNDNYGHDGGDSVLKSITCTLTESLRDIDLLARYGGEEFIALLPNTNMPDAFIVAQRVRLAVEKSIVQHGAHEIRVTTSVGISEISPEDKDYESVIKRADVALYAAKNAGRNKVVIV